MDVQEILAAWYGEGPTVDERTYTRWAEEGFHSWNGWAAEREFCELAAALARMVGGPVVETGVGGGYTTVRLSKALGGRGLLCFESDPELRAALRELSFFRSGLVAALSEKAGPSSEDLEDAALTVLDSDVPYRLEEIALWAANARDGALLLVHDCGNGHADGSIWMELRKQVLRLGIKGALLRNPRGAFLGVR